MSPHFFEIPLRETASHSWKSAMKETRRHPEHLDFLEAVYELYVQKGSPEKPPIIILAVGEIADMVRRQGFNISNDLVWQRLYEYNKTIEIRSIERTLPGTLGDFEQKVMGYWLCQDAVGTEDWKQREALTFQMGVVTNEIAALTRKRQLEEEQLRFWRCYKWAAIATILLALVISACAVMNLWFQHHGT